MNSAGFPPVSQGIDEKTCQIEHRRRHIFLVIIRIFYKISEELNPLSTSELIAFEF
jgi:hypothetical protein